MTIVGKIHVFKKFCLRLMSAILGSPAQLATGGSGANKGEGLNS